MAKKHEREWKVYEFRDKFGFKAYVLSSSEMNARYTLKMNTNQNVDMLEWKSIEDIDKDKVFPRFYSYTGKPPEKQVQRKAGDKFQFYNFKDGLQAACILCTSEAKARAFLYNRTGVKNPTLIKVTGLDAINDLYGFILYSRITMII